MRRESMKRNRLFRLDYSMLSSYLGRWSTVLVFTVIILIAAGALFLEEDDIAHMPVEIGVYDLDSAVVHQRLEDLARFVRGKGGGDIEWTYMGDGDEPEGCDFYIMTSLRLAPYLERGELDCSLIATMMEGKRYSRGVVIMKAGEGRDDGSVDGAIFTSPFSAAGFLSPYRAIIASGVDLSPAVARIDFAGTEERVLYGIVFGSYRFGGISLERLQYFEERGMVREGEIEVVMQGESYPEMVFAASRNGEERKLNRFRDRFLLLTGRMPFELKTDLYCIGLSGFAEPRPADIDVIRTLADMVPSWAKPRRGAAPGAG